MLDTEHVKIRCGVTATRCIGVVYLDGDTITLRVGGVQVLRLTPCHVCVGGNEDALETSPAHDVAAALKRWAEASCLRVDVEPSKEGGA